jgi:hypothetical protein
MKRSVTMHHPIGVALAAVVLVAPVIFPFPASGQAIAGKEKTAGNTVAATASSREMVRAAQAFLGTLSAEQRRTATYPFAAEERFNWYFVPRDRKGLPLRDMNAGQRQAAMHLLGTALSEGGMGKAKAIMELEVVLKALEGLPPENDRRHPEKFYFTVFGTPAAREVWGWRVEGHHLSLNVTTATGKVVAETPAFLGANPAIVPSGPEQGKQILKAEADLGFALLGSFTPEQLQQAVIAETAPNEIVTGNRRQAMMGAPEGIHYAEMTPGQQAMLRGLLELYLGNYQPDLAADLRRKVEKGGMDQLHFAWAGHRTPETGKAHYYRIHSPVILIEYDNSQTNANHVHTVVRDLTNDFGEDALREHYFKHKHGN